MLGITDIIMPGSSLYLCAHVCICSHVCLSVQEHEEHKGNIDVSMFSLSTFSTLLHFFFQRDLPLNPELDILASIAWLVGPWDLAAFAPDCLAYSARVT